MKTNGKLIVLDGLDGSGKSTQFELIQKKLNACNVPVKAISFPDYEQPSSALVKMYLNGEFSKNAEDINAYAASSFYAVDRYASYKLFWEKNYLDGDLILASRYVSSNAIHQMVKLPKEEWKSFLVWLWDYEHNKLGLPEADLVLFLDMPVAVSQKLMTERYHGDETKKDIHEANLHYLDACRESALFAAKEKGWQIISCSDGDEPYSIEKISEEIMLKINEVL